MNIIVTTVYEPDPRVLHSACSWAEQLKLPFIPRERHSLDTLRKTHNSEILLLASQAGPVVDTPGGRYFFHLSMADLRIKQIINGKHDHMVAAMALEAGMSVLDCTLGLATDAIVASYIVSESGRITGLESSSLIALVAEIGLSSFTAETAAITAALRRIKVQNTYYLEYLSMLPDASYDIVFFDPMFQRPVEDSSNLKPLRHLANHQPLTCLAMQEARRVARSRVVVKEARGSRIFQDLGITTLSGGKYSSVQYGILEVAK